MLVEHKEGVCQRRRVDRLAASGGGLALVMTVFYIWLMRQAGYGSQVWDFVIRAVDDRSRNASVDVDSRSAAHCYCVGHIRREDYILLPTYRASIGRGGPNADRNPSLAGHQFDRSPNLSGRTSLPHLGERKKTTSDW